MLMKSLGRNTADYHAVLAEVGRGAWRPERSARPWLEFCLSAHYRQAQTLLRRIQETEALWDACDQLRRARRLPDRCIGPLCDAARGFRLHRSRYVKVVGDSAGEVIPDEMATRDLRALTSSGLLEAIGEKRGRYYRGTPLLVTSWRREVATLSGHS